MIGGCGFKVEHNRLPFRRPWGKPRASHAGVPRSGLRRSAGHIGWLLLGSNDVTGTRRLRAFLAEGNTPSLEHRRACCRATPQNGQAQRRRLERRHIVVGGERSRKKCADRQGREPEKSDHGEEKRLTKGRLQQRDSKRSRLVEEKRMGKSCHGLSPFLWWLKVTGFYDEYNLEQMPCLFAGVSGGRRTRILDRGMMHAGSALRACKLLRLMAPI